MKNLTKKCGVITAAVALLLLSAVLVTTCDNGIPTGKPDTYKPAPGMGAVRLNFGSEVRSIVPGTTFSSFTTFDIGFSATTPGKTDNTHTGVSSTDVAGPYDLVPGTYTINVVGYTALGEAAAASVTDIVIAQGILNDSIGTIYLEAPSPTAAGATDTGTFTWTISGTGTTGTTVATMTFDKIAGSSGTTPGPFNLLGGTSPNSWAGTYSFPTGFYYVDIAIKKNDITRTFRHILQVYTNMNSAFTYTIDQDFFTFTRALLDIDFNTITDDKPTLQSVKLPGPATTPLEQYDIVTVTVNAPESINIQVTNQGIYSSPIVWNFNGTDLSTGLSGLNNSILTIDTAIAPFKVVGKYPLAVIGTTGTIPYATIIYIEITP